MGHFGDLKPYILLEPAAMKDLNSMTKYFQRYLRRVSRIHKDKHIFILLDSLDQMKMDDISRSMKWLPMSGLPLNVHVIVSTLPNTHGILDTLKKTGKLDEIQNSESCFLELKPIPEETSLDIVDTYLGSKGRKITENQRKLILETFKKMPTPLFLKILLDKAVMWNSYSDLGVISEKQLASTVQEAIAFMFKDLEKKYGVKLIQTLLGYITVGENLLVSAL